MTISVSLPELTTTHGSRNKETAWRRRWPLPVSVLLHAMIGAVFLCHQDASPPSPPLPRIELLPPAPVLPTPEEATPNPADAALKPPATFPKIAEPPPAPHPPAAASDKTERRSPQPPKKKPFKPEPPQGETVPQDSSSKIPVDTATLPTSGAKATPDSILGDPNPGGRVVGPPSDYIGLIRARLEKVKRYPAAARNAGQEGIVQLDVLLDKTGQVARWKIIRGSGFEALDEEVGAMIERAAFPPFPASFDQDSLHLLVPVEFSLKRS